MKNTPRTLGVKYIEKIFKYIGVFKDTSSYHLSTIKVILILQYTLKYLPNTCNTFEKPYIPLTYVTIPLLYFNIY
jgi:hypothetical protein